MTLFDLRVFPSILISTPYIACGSFTLYRSAHLSLVERSPHVNAVFITFDKEEISVKIRSLITGG